MESTLGELKNIFKEKEKLVDRNGNCLITQSQNSTPGWLQIVEQKANKTSLWKRWSPLLENLKTSSKRKRSLSIICKHILQIFYHQTNLHIDNNKIGHLVGIHHIKNICNLYRHYVS